MESTQGAIVYGFPAFTDMNIEPSYKDNLAQVYTESSCGG